MYSAKTNHGTHYTQVICENGHRLTTGKEISAEERAAVVKDVEDIIKHAPREGIATQKLRAVMKKVGFQAANVLSSALGGALGEQSRIVIFGP